MQDFLRKHKLRLGLTLAALAICVVVLIFRVQTYDPFAADAIKDPPFNSLTYGIQASLWWDKRIASLHLAYMQLMVFSHVKEIFAWEDIQPEPDQWVFARADEVVNEVESKGLKLVARLSETPYWAHSVQVDEREVVDAPPDDPADFGAYCGTLAERYKGRIAAYQVWNEPNLAREWGGAPPDAAGYTALLKACAEAIRAADPDAIIISAGLSPTGTYDDRAHPDDVYLNELYDAGFQQYADVIGLHAPGYSPPTMSLEDAEREGRARWATFRHIEDMRRIMVERRDAARQIAILEFGWPLEGIGEDYAWFAVSEEEQAQYLVEAYAYAAEHWRPWVGLMSAIYFAKPSWTPDDEQFWWSIVKPDGDGRPAFIALSNMAKYCGERFIPERAPDSPEALGLVTTDPCD